MMQNYSDAKMITSPLLTKTIYLNNKITPSYLRDLISLSVEHYVNVLS